MLTTNQPHQRVGALSDSLWFNDAALHQYATQCLSRGHTDTAAEILYELTQRQADNADFWDHLGAAHMMAHRHVEADEAFSKCLALGGGYQETLLNAVHNARQGGNATQQLRYACRLMSFNADVRPEGLLQAASALGKLGRTDEAIAICRQLLHEVSLHATPSNVKIAYAVVRGLLEMRCPEEALIICGNYLAVDSNQMGLRMAQIEALLLCGELAHALRLAELLIEEHPDMLEAIGALAFNYQYVSDMGVLSRKAHASRYGAVLINIVRQNTSWSNLRQPDRPLQVGLLSGDLRHHPIGYFFASALQALTNSSLQFTAYDTLNRPDNWTAQMREHLYQWRSCHALNDAQLVAQIQSDQIDVLIDLHGHSTGNRLAVMCAKPAPVQLSYMGFLGTVGVPGIDYVLADPFCVPAGVEPPAEDEFTEQVWRLPTSYYCFTSPGLEVDIGGLPALKNGYITYGCFNKPDKLNDKVLRLWARLLNSQPSARLLLRGAGYDVKPYRQHFEQRMQLCGIDLARVTLLRPSARPWFFQTYEQIDIALDPFPYSGATSTAEALWLGIPVLALKGDRMVWRMGESLLRNAGMSDWLAKDEEDFVRLAQVKAADLPALALLRARQRSLVEKSPLMDAQRFAGEFETAIRQMWQRWCQT